RCEATDGSGNQVCCSFSVTVNEPSPLRIHYGASLGGSNLVTLHWGGDLVLQQTDSLVPPVFWRNVEVKPARDSNERTLVLSGTGAQGFFRLAVQRPVIPEIPVGYDDNDQDFSSEPIKFTGLSNVIALLPTYHIRIHAIAVADDNGSKAATITPTSL